MTAICYVLKMFSTTMYFVLPTKQIAKITWTDYRPILIHRGYNGPFGVGEGRSSSLLL